MTLTAQQLASRNDGIGGSDAAAAVGLSPYKTPYELWLEKTGRREPEDLSDNDRVYFGNLLEDVVASEFARRRNCRVQRHRATIVHPKHAILRAHIDRRLIGVREGLECKTADLRMAARWGEEDTDDIPLEYWAQSVHYLAVTGFSAWHVAALIGGNTFRSYIVPRDEEAIEALISKELAFWDCVRTDTPPDPITLDDATLRWPSHIEGKRLVATAEIASAVASLSNTKARIKELEAEKAAAELKIKSFLGDAESLLDAEGRTLCTWKQAKASRVFDKERFEQEQPELHEHYLTTRPGSRRFLVK